MNKLITDHSQDNLQNLFGGTVAGIENELCSILVKETQMPWLIIIPKVGLDDSDAMGSLYAQIHKIAAKLQTSLASEHYNLAKIGNKNPWLHMHLVFRNEQDECWPDPIWCHEPLKENKQSAQALQKLLQAIEI